MLSILNKIIYKAGFQIHRNHRIEVIANKLFQKYQNFTMISNRMYIENLKLIYNHSKINGCVVECGVWRGGMSAGMAEILPEKNFYLFDSFQGLPEAKEIDGKSAIKWQKNKEGVNFYNNCSAEIGFAKKAMQLSKAKYELIKGWFNVTLPTMQFEEEIAILRLDGDWYDSTIECLENLFPKVARNGIIILDDYYTWDGCSRAVHYYLSSINSVSRIQTSQFGIPYIIKKD